MPTTTAIAPLSPIDFLTTKPDVPEGPWFHFRQNNSGGYFIGPKHVVMIAENEDAAWERLRSMEDYSSSSCDCCGARWGWADSLTREETLALLTDLASPEHWDNKFDPQAGPVCVILL